MVKIVKSIFSVNNKKKEWSMSIKKFIALFALFIPLLSLSATLDGLRDRVRELNRGAVQGADSEARQYLYELTVLCKGLDGRELKELIREGGFENGRIRLEVDFKHVADDENRYINGLRAFDLERGLEFYYDSHFNPVKLFVVNSRSGRTLLVRYRPDSLAFLSNNSKIEEAHTMEDRVESLERLCVPPSILSSLDNMETLFRNPADRELEFLPFAHSFLKNMDFSPLPENYSYGLDDFKRIVFFTKRLSRSRLLRKLPEVEGELERYFINPGDDELVVKKEIERLILSSSLPNLSKRDFLQILRDGETKNRSKWFIDYDRLRLFALKAVSTGLVTAFEIEEEPINIVNRLLASADLYSRAAALEIRIPADSMLESMLRETAALREKERAELSQGQHELIVKLNRRLLTTIFPHLAPPFRTIEEKLKTLVPRYQPMSIFGFTPERDEKDPDRVPIDAGTLSDEQYRRELARYYIEPEQEQVAEVEPEWSGHSLELVPRKSAAGGGLKSCYLLSELVELFRLEEYIKEDNSFRKLMDYPVHSLTIREEAGEQFSLHIRLWPERFTQSSNSKFHQLRVEAPLPLELLEELTYIEPLIVPAASRLVGPNLRESLFGN